MSLIAWIYAIARSFINIPVKYQDDMNSSESRTIKWYEGLDAKSGAMAWAKKNVLAHPLFELVLLCAYNFVGRWIQNLGKPKEESEKSIKDLIKELDEQDED